MSVEVIKTFSTVCNGILHEAIDNDVAFTAVLEQIVYDGGATTSFFFDVTLSGPKDTALIIYLAGGDAQLYCPKPDYKRFIYCV